MSRKAVDWTTRTRESKSRRIDMTSYSLYLEAKGFSQNTVDSYMYAVSQFEQRVSRIDDRALLEHKEWLMASFSARTANARIAALNAYLDFVGYKGLRLKGSSHSAETLFGKRGQQRGISYYRPRPPRRRKPFLVRADSIHGMHGCPSERTTPDNDRAS